MIEGTGSIIHDFDGCCFGLRQKFGVSNMYIKKRWRISSWNVGIGNRLSLRCDGRHEHAPCAGRETLHAQIYTSKIASIILQEQRPRCGIQEAQPTIVHGVGSSGTNSKKYVVAAARIGINNSHNIKHSYSSPHRLKPWCFLQIALNIRIYNFDNQMINGRLTISQLADDIVKALWAFDIRSRFPQCLREPPPSMHC